MLYWCERGVVEGDDKDDEHVELGAVEGDVDVPCKFVLNLVLAKAAQSEDDESDKDNGDETDDWLLENGEHADDEFVDDVNESFGEKLGLGTEVLVISVLRL